MNRSSRVIQHRYRSECCVYRGPQVCLGRRNQVMRCKQHSGSASGQRSLLGPATLQAVTRVKLEQASKVVMWTPTRPRNAEGSTDREETRAGARNSPTNEHLIRSTGVLST